MYTNFKSPIFQKQDVSNLQKEVKHPQIQTNNQQLKDNIQDCVDNPSNLNMQILSRTLDALTLILDVPSFTEELFRSTNMMTQVELLQLRIGKWPASEQKDQLNSSFRQLLRRLYLSTPPVIKEIIAKSKAPQGIANEQYVPFNSVQYLADSRYFILYKIFYVSFYIEHPFIESYTTLLRVFRIQTLYYDKVRQDDGQKAIPQEFFFFHTKPLPQENEIIKQWDGALQVLLQPLKLNDYNVENQVRGLDLIIFLCRDNAQLKQVVIEQGALRILLQKCGSGDVALDVGRRSLVLIRDICSGNWMTTDLMSRYETEKHLMKLMQKFRGDNDISDLISQILELLIKGYDLDLENLDKNMKMAQERLVKYVKTPKESDPSKALSNVEVLRFYSLMSSYVKRIVSYQFDDLLLQVYEVEHGWRFEELIMGQDTDHLKLLIAVGMVLEKIVQHSDQFNVERGNTKRLQILVKELYRGIERINSNVKRTSASTTATTLYTDCLLTYLSLLQMVLQSEGTKVMGCEFVKQNKLDNLLLEMKQTWDDNQNVTKFINGQLFTLAKSSKEEADKLIKRLVIPDAFIEKQQQLQQQPQLKQNPGKLTEDHYSSFQVHDDAANQQPKTDYTRKRRNIEFIATLSDLPQAAQQIMQSKIGLEAILEILVQENQFMLGLYPEYMESEVDESIYMLDLGTGKEDEDFNIDMVLQKAENPEELRQLLMEKRQLLVKTVEVLRKLVRNDEFKKKAVNEPLLREILTFCRLFSKSRNEAILGLRVLNEVAGDEAFQGILQENKGVESIFMQLNCHPTERDVIELGGNVLKQLGGEEISRSVKVQYDDLRKSFSMQDVEGMEAIRQANIYLSNLMTVIPEEETSEIVNENGRVIAALQVFFQKDLNDQFLGSLLLLLSRLGNQGEETKRILRNSDIGMKIVNYILMDMKRAGQSGSRIVELALDVLINMVGGGGERLNALESSSGCEIASECDMEEISPMEQVFMKYQLKPLERVVNMLNKQMMGQGVFSKLQGAASSICENEGSVNSLFEGRSMVGLIGLQQIEKASCLLSVLCRYEKSFVERSCEMRGQQYCLEIFHELCERHLGVQAKSVAFQKCGSILGELCRVNQEVYMQVCLDESVVPSLVELLEKTRVDDQFVNNLASMEQVGSVLKFLERFLDQQFDSSLLSRRNLQERYGRLVKGFVEYFTSNLKQAMENAYLCLLMKDVLNVLCLLLNDPLSHRELATDNYLIPLQRLLGEVLRQSQPSLQADYTSDELCGSPDTFVRILESAYKVIHKSLSEYKNAQQYSQLYHQDQTLPTLALLHYNNPYLVSQTLSILTLLSLIKQITYLTPNYKALTNYTNIPFIQRQYAQLTHILTLSPSSPQYAQLTNQTFHLQFTQLPQLQIHQQQPHTITQESIVKDESENILNKKKQAAQGDVDSNTAQATIWLNQNASTLIHDLDQLSTLLDLLLQQSLDDHHAHDSNWIQNLLQIIQTIQQFVTDNQSASKIHHFQITNTLLSLLMLDDHIHPSINLTVCNALAHILSFTESAKIYQAKIALFEPYKIYTQYLLSKPNSPTLTPFCQIVKHTVSLDEMQTKLVKQLLILPIASLITKIKELPALISAAECLDRYGSTEKIAQLYHDQGVTTTILTHFQANCNNPAFSSAFCLLIGTLCRSQTAQAQLSQNKIYIPILKGMNADLNNIKLLANSFYALSGLCYNNKPVSVEIIDSGIIKMITSFLNKYPQETVLVETICSVVSNLTFKNDQNKKILGDAGVIELLVQIYKHYAFEQEFRPKTIKQLLRSIGNACFLYENTTRLMKTNFMQSSIQQITQKMLFIENGEVLRHILDVYSNLCSHPEESNRANIETINKEPFIETVLQVLRKNILLADIVLSGMDTLDGLVQSKVYSMQIAEKGGIEIVLKIMKSHDWNDVVINKCFRLLANMSLLKQNTDFLVKNHVPLGIADALKNIKVISNPKLLMYAYKIVHRIAGDKGKEKALHKCGSVEAINEILSKRGTNENHLELIMLLNKIAQYEDALETIARKASQTVTCKVVEFPKNHQQYEVYVKESLLLLERLFSQARIVDSVDVGQVIFVYQSLLTETTVSLDCKQIIIKSIIAMCSGSEQARKLCIKQHLDEDLKKIKADSKLAQLKQTTQLALQAIYQEEQVEQKMGETQKLSKISPQQMQDYIKFLMNGFQCKMYTLQYLIIMLKRLRNDGSSKVATIQATGDLAELVAKQPNGIVKKKYRIPLLDIAFTKFNYTANGPEWSQSVFAKCGSGMFSKRIVPEKCFTINSKVTADDEIAQINGETVDVQQKMFFEQALKAVVHGIRSGEIKMK